jgi:hypothetical protein
MDSEVYACVLINNGLYSELDYRRLSVQPDGRVFYSDGAPYFSPYNGAYNSDGSDS